MSADWGVKVFTVGFSTKESEIIGMQGMEHAGTHRRGDPEERRQFHPRRVFPCQ
jgi:hypothetical protein